MEEDDLTLKEKLDNVIQHSKELGETGYKLAILEVTDKVAKLISNLIIILVIFFLLNALLFFMGFALANWLSHLLNSPVIAFSIVSGLYLLLVIILFALRRKLIIPFFMNLFVKKIYE